MGFRLVNCPLSVPFVHYFALRAIQKNRKHEKKNNVELCNHGDGKSSTKDYVPNLCRSTIATTTMGQRQRKRTIY